MKAFAPLAASLMMFAAQPALAQQETKPAAQAPAAAKPAQPKLLIAIAMDQFSSELFNEYRPTFTGGLKRMTEGVVFPAGYQGHAATETCPGHSTLLTGSFPARTGIVANNWFDFSTPREDKRVYCSEDTRAPGSTSRKYVASPNHLMVDTLGEYMVRANPAARNFAVSGKDRGALMMGGRTVQQAYWWGGDRFVTLAGRTEIPTITEANKAIAQKIAAGNPAMAASGYCQTKSNSLAAGKVALGMHRFERPAGDTRLFRASPELDAATLAVAMAMVRDYKLGQGAATDMLSISLSATDYVGHALGNQGIEMCLQLGSVDRDLGAFFDWLDKQQINYAVVLTADHGGLDAPERAQAQANPAARRNDGSTDPKALGDSIAKALRIADSKDMLMSDGDFGDFYVNPRFAAQRGKVVAEAVKQLKTNNDVAAVFTREQLAAMPIPSGSPETWTLAERARASFYAPRSGDLVVLLKSRVTPIHEPDLGYVATHGSAWDYDRRVPILFWYKGIKPFEQPAGVNTADILPTLASLIGLPLDASKFDGRCLDLDPGTGDSCR